MDTNSCSAIGNLKLRRYTVYKYTYTQKINICKILNKLWIIVEVSRYFSFLHFQEKLFNIRYHDAIKVFLTTGLSVIYCILFLEEEIYNIRKFCLSIHQGRYTLNAMFICIFIQKNFRERMYDFILFKFCN